MYARRVPLLSPAGFHMSGTASQTIGYCRPDFVEESGRRYKLVCIPLRDESQRWVLNGVAPALEPFISPYAGAL